ncbi:MAG: sensor domain-containing diguanylate cyclase [Planctomycetota bacterium]|jgi:diguanylate cyclase (GGDEF)-like protein
MTASILDRVLACPGLPVLPPVTAELMELIHAPQAEPAEVDALLQRDPVLAGKILDAVNSRHFELSEPCTTIGGAVASIGLDPVRSLAAGFSLMGVTKCCEAQLDLLDFWRRGLMSAAAARHIAVVTCGCNPQDAFIAALMQDIGMAAMHSALGQTYVDVLAGADGNHRVLPRRERTLLGVTHAEVGALLGRKWSLPVWLVDPIRRHHCRHAGDSDHSPIVNTVVMGCQISYLCLAPLRKPDVARAGAMSRRFFGLSSIEARALLAGASGEARRLLAGLNGRGDGLADAGAILTVANEALVAHRADTRELSGAGPAVADSLVGVSDRAGFDRELTARFAQTRDAGGRLSLILIEIDELAAPRDGRGPAGQTVMGALAPVLRSDGSGDCIVSLYGPDTFAVIVPGASRFESAKLAERLRQAIGQQRIEADSDGRELRVTASVGVAALEPEVADRLAEPGPLLRLADGALRTARKAGRNCVRIFSPKAA